MPDMTTHEAAAYLASKGYTVGRRRAGGKGAPAGDTLKHWCKQGRFQGARKSGDRWLIPKEELDKLIGAVC